MNIDVKSLSASSRVRPDQAHEVRSACRGAAEWEPNAGGDGEERGATLKRKRCENCNAVSRVLILDGYARGQPVLRRLCLDCAARAAPKRAACGGERARVTWHALVSLAGFVLCVVGLAGDWLVPGGHAGFGWHQQMGAVTGVLLILVGLLLRADVIALAGAFLLGAALCSDWFGLTRGPGIGWKQQYMAGAGVLCLLFGGLVRLAFYVRRTRLARGPAAERQGRGAAGAAAAVDDELSASGAAAITTG